MGKSSLASALELHNGAGQELRGFAYSVSELPRILHVLTPALSLGVDMRWIDERSLLPVLPFGRRPVGCDAPAISALEMEQGEI